MVNAADIVRSTAEAAFASDGEGRIVAWNAAAERLLGHSAARVVGRRCASVLCGRDVFGNQYCSRDCPVTRMARQHQAVHGFEMALLTASGERLAASLHVLVVDDGQAMPVLVHLIEPLEGLGRRSTTDGGLATAGGKPPSPERSKAQLTHRELEVLALLAAGAGTRGIADRLFISTTTVRNHIQRLLAKLGAHSRLEAVSQARRQGLV